MTTEQHVHDHTHVAPGEAIQPGDHSHAVAPATPHLHGHHGHPRTTAAPAGVDAPAVRVEDLCAGYHGRDVLDEVSFSVPRAEMVGIIGPNGSGKTTLLKVIAGMLAPQCGDVSIFGLPPGDVPSRIIGYVPQIETVNWSFPVTVFDVVMMGRYSNVGLFRRPSRADRDAVMAALREVGMHDLAASQIGQLSGGQQQRTFIARALVGKPELLLLDEPIAGVDATTQHAIFTLLEERKASGMTILASTHDLSCVSAWFDRVLCLNHRVIAYGPPDAVLDSATLSETFGSHMLVLPHSDGHGDDIDYEAAAPR